MVPLTIFLIPQIIRCCIGAVASQKIISLHVFISITNTVKHRTHRTGNIELCPSNQCVFLLPTGNPQTDTRSYTSSCPTMMDIWAGQGGAGRLLLFTLWDRLQSVLDTSIDTSVLTIINHCTHKAAFSVCSVDNRFHFVLFKSWSIGQWLHDISSIIHIHIMILQKLYLIKQPSKTKNWTRFLNSMQIIYALPPLNNLGKVLF